ncbi:MAG: bifunctional diaminohydroxyphosphoribosylaminopyrimidine deaminase/5-amino-6-(5-phosphoribosylamino)uracil reductase RibD [Desulfatitalea sp.]|nr:bifunctional diaminohydroxyphosphoribosylaminopyrimidine deaminase/5-amino-6-(5-phosphoribosylamino)uracil reductase RibD [Desulfatitalea sp.]
MDDSDFMAQALALAARGAGRVSPNPLVGAVVVQNGRIVGRGWDQAVGGPHAEVHALNDAGDQTNGATLYVTLEPCNHQGRTPPCTERILQAGIRRVVVAMADPNPHVQGGGNAYLSAKGLAVTVGIGAAKAYKLNESFVKFVQTGQPWVVLKMAATLDGRIATRTGDARWVTGKAARGRVHAMRHAMDAIMVGIGTVKADDPRLTTRLPDEQGVDPVRIVLDTGLSMAQDAKMLHQTSTAGTYVVCGPAAKAADRDRLTACGAKILEAPLRNERIDLAALMAHLGDMGITSLLVEGGARVAADALTANIVDHLVLFYAPKLLGGDDGIPMFSGPGPEWMRDALNIYDVTVEPVGNDIMVQGYTKKCLPAS